MGRKIKRRLHPPKSSLFKKQSSLPSFLLQRKSPGTARGEMKLIWNCLLSLPARIPTSEEVKVSTLVYRLRILTLHSEQEESQEEFGLFIFPTPPEKDFGTRPRKFGSQKEDPNSLAAQMGLMRLSIQLQKMTFLFTQKLSSQNLVEVNEVLYFSEGKREGERRASDLGSTSNWHWHQLHPSRWGTSWGT